MILQGSLSKNGKSRAWSCWSAGTRFCHCASFLSPGSFFPFSTSRSQQWLRRHCWNVSNPLIGQNQRIQNFARLSMHTELSSSNRSVINLVSVTLRASTESQLSAKPKPVVEDEEDEEEDNSSDEEGCDREFPWVCQVATCSQNWLVELQSTLHYLIQVYKSLKNRFPYTNSLYSIPMYLFSQKNRSCCQETEFGLTCVGWRRYTVFIFLANFLAPLEPRLFQLQLDFIRILDFHFNFGEQKKVQTYALVFESYLVAFCLKLTMSGALEDEWLDDGAIKIGSDEEYHWAFR